MIQEPKITLIGCKQAKKNFSFFHEGPLKECKACPLFEICMMNLEPKRVYKVIEVKKKLFPCKVHEEGARVVKVIETDYKTTINNRYVFPQGIITYKPQQCNEVACTNYSLCVPQGLTEGDKGKILEVIGQLQCPHDHHLVLIALRRVP